MSNAILLHWLNFSKAVSRLPLKAQPLSPKQRHLILETLLGWYGEFTDVPADQLRQIEKNASQSSKTVDKREVDRLREAVYSAVEFLRAYLEPAEIVNMSQYGATKKTLKDFARMTERMATYHGEKMDSLKWLTNWLEKVDALFPADVFRNKLACCFSPVKEKACFTNNRKCIFEPSLAWIRTPTATWSGIAADSECCLGATLSSCSGGTLTCDCVAGNTGCDCKSPNQLCGKNDKSVAVNAAGFAGLSCQLLDPREKEWGGSMNPPVCLALDPLRKGGCMLDEFPGISTSSRPSLDLRQGRFLTSHAGTFHLGRAMITARDCTQTGFCPPKGGGCDNLC